MKNSVTNIKKREWNSLASYENRVRFIGRLILNMRSLYFWSILFLKMFIFFALTMSTGKLFHVLQTRFVKKLWYSFLLLEFLMIVKLWPLSLELVLKLNRVLTDALSYLLWAILYVSIKSPLNLLYSKLGRLVFFSLSS